MVNKISKVCTGQDDGEYVDRRNSTLTFNHRINDLPDLYGDDTYRRPSMEEFFSFTSSGESANFRGFGEVDKAFIPLLEEVCAKQPSLVECVQDKGEDFTQWAFSTLGRVLYFLDTRKGKDITAECCRELKMVWATVSSFKFDLRWLQNDYEAALEVEDEAERTKTLREEMNSVDTWRKRLKAQLAQVKANFEEVQEKVADIERLIEGGLQLGRGSA